MKNKKMIICLLLLVAMFLYAPAVWSDSGSQTLWANEGFQIEKQSSVEFVPGEILVKFKESTNQSEISALNSYMRAREFKRIQSINVRCIKLPPDISVDDAVAQYKMYPNVEYAEPNYIYHFTAMPNDSNFSNLWGLHNTGQQVEGVFGTMDADIDAPEAWDITTGSDDVIIAVIDSGVAYLHPEIKPNMWINTLEFGGSAGVDDDSNGYVDDIYGWDFWANDKDPTDFYLHGTHISGIIAGLGNNGTAITGVNWKAAIMALRAGGSVGVNIITAAKAITYAVDNGADIINASWGSTNFSQGLFDAISYANDHGVLLIAAAGNGGTDGIGDNNEQVPYYPSSFNLPNIISVAATDQDDNLTNFSNFGSVSVDVGAPGDNIYSTVPQISTGSRVVLYSEDFDPSPAGWVSGGTNSSWAFVDGTGVGGSVCLEDSPAGNYLNNTNSVVGFVGSGSPFPSVKDNLYNLSFKINMDLENEKDSLLLFTSVDGNNWVPPGNYFTGFTGGFVDASFNLTLVADLLPSFYFGFGLYSNSSVTRDGVYIDNLVLYRQPLIVSGYGYEYFNGTSMAAPYVSGVAGLVMDQNPDYNHIQIRDAIFNTVDKLPSLIGKAATEGRINAFKAVTYIAPVSNFHCTAGNGAVSLNWNANSESAVKGYIVSYGENASLANQIDVGDVTTYEIGGLTNGKVYYFAVSSVAEFPVIGEVNSASSDSLAATPNGPPTPSPSNFTGAGGGGGGCFITTTFSELTK
jgi:subtilisin family serine protease